MNLKPAITALMLAANLSHAQNTTPAKPTFEVASIKLNSNCLPARPGIQPAGMFVYKCVPLEIVIRVAWVNWISGYRNLHGRWTELVGGPRWVYSDYYDFSAKADPKTTRAQIYGPMLQALLEERFKLRVHRDTKTVPVYALTLAKVGLKIQHSKDGDCIPADDSSGQPPTAPSTRHICGVEVARPGGQGFVYDLYGVTMADLAELLSVRMDRDVIDKTGVPGKYDVHLTFAPDESTPGFPNLGGSVNGVVGTPADLAAGSTGTSIFAAIDRQLGLKLESDKGPGDILVIDSVERPSEN